MMIPLQKPSLGQLVTWIHTNCLTPKVIVGKWTCFFYLLWTTSLSKLFGRNSKLMFKGFILFVLVCSFRVVLWFVFKVVSMAITIVENL